MKDWAVSSLNPVHLVYPVEKMVRPNSSVKDENWLVYRGKTISVLRLRRRRLDFGCFLFLAGQSHAVVWFAFLFVEASEENGQCHYYAPQGRRRVLT